MVIDRENEFVYVCIPRTGSVAISEHLHSVFPNAVRTVNHHATRVFAPYHNFFIWTTVRNPYARILSHYRLRKKIQPIFKDWSFERYVQETVAGSVRNHGIMNDRPMLTYRDDRASINYFKLENIKEWWGTIHFLDGVDLPVRKNQSDKKAGGEYNTRLAAMVYEFCKQDFERFKYDKESWI